MLGIVPGIILTWKGVFLMSWRKIGFYLTLLFILFQFPVFAADDDIQINSEAAVLIDAKTGQVLYGKNENQKMSPASLTKIATTIYAIENGNLNDMVTVSEQATDVEGTKVYLEPGEVLPLEMLIIGMMVNSRNDAANAISEHLDGNMERFAQNINRYVQEEIGVHHTHFENPSGLFGENHYTTAVDLAEITRYAMKNEKFRSIFGMIEFEWNGQSWDTTLLTHHRLLKGEFPCDARITGGKNGYISEAGFTLVTTAEKNGLELVAVTLNADNRMHLIKIPSNY